MKNPRIGPGTPKNMSKSASNQDLETTKTEKFKPGERLQTDLAGKSTFGSNFEPKFIDFRMQIRLKICPARTPVKGSIFAWSFIRRPLFPICLQKPKPFKIIGGLLKIRLCPCCKLCQRIGLPWLDVGLK